VFETMEKTIPDVGIDDENIWVLPFKGTELNSTNVELLVSSTFKDATNSSFFYCGKKFIFGMNVSFCKSSICELKFWSSKLYLTCLKPEDFVPNVNQSIVDPFLYLFFLLALFVHCGNQSFSTPLVT
jgi:hypothetical protein